MKRLFSKKSGFTLVEIVIALAIFAIMASMIAQMLNLTIQRRKSNTQFERSLQEQQENLIATKGTNTVYDEEKDEDGTLNLKFGDDGAELTIKYQLRSADGTVGDKNGVNYFVGDMDYNGANDGSVTEDDPLESEDDVNNQVGPQSGRFDSRLEGTKGLSYIQINSITKNSDTQYTVEVIADDSTVQSDKRDFGQYTLFFDKKGGDVRITKLEATSTPDGLTVRKSGSNGVKVAVNKKDKSLNQTVKFTVTFNKAPSEALTPNSFGSNASSGKYNRFSYGSTVYENIYGAYIKTNPSNPNPPAQPDPTDPDAPPVIV